MVNVHNLRSHFVYFKYYFPFDLTASNQENLHLQKVCRDKELLLTQPAGTNTYYKVANNEQLTQLICREDSDEKLSWKTQINILTYFFKKRCKRYFLVNKLVSPNERDKQVKQQKQQRMA